MLAGKFHDLLESPGKKNPHLIGGGQVGVTITSKTRPAFLEKLQLCCKPLQVVANLPQPTAGR